MGGVALLVLLGVLIEQMTPTDTKRVRQTLETAAAALQANSEQQVSPASCPAPTATPRGGRLIGPCRSPNSTILRSATSTAIQLSNESTHGGDDFHRVRPRHGSRRHVSRRNLPVCADERQAPQGVGPVAGLWRAAVRRAGVGRPRHQTPARLPGCEAVLLARPVSWPPRHETPARLPGW